MKKLVYISHPSSGKLENTLDIEVIIKALYKSDAIYNNYCFVSPVHNYGFMYNDTDYDRGLTYCTDLLEHCEEIWVFGDYANSRGCKAEIKLAEKLGIPILYMGASFNIDKTISEIESKLGKKSITPSEKSKTSKTSIRLYKCIPRHSKIKDAEDIKGTILYTDINDAIESFRESALYSAFKLVQIDVKVEKLFDMLNNDNLFQYHKYVLEKYNISKYKIDVNEKEHFDSYIADNKIKIVKRTIIYNRDEFGAETGKIPKDTKTVYSVLDTSIIEKYKVFNGTEISEDIKSPRYIINDSITD